MSCLVEEALLFRGERREKSRTHSVFYWTRLSLSLCLSLPVSLGGGQVLPVPSRERELHANGTVESCGRLP